MRHFLARSIHVCATSQPQQDGALTYGFDHLGHDLYNARLVPLALTSQKNLFVVTFGMARLEVGRSVFLKYRGILEEE